ncbi:MAG: NAD(P)H-dependent oxidoreductase subunit E [Betaproteobacteria bacterium]|nr:NAD(P)H-dependent oxidoreductase subunit E [Betaproteobacteria bacterium]MDE2422738.1 NAD(P)H-dependent oxidoreductase subunit E [Betaproteobacteria bacterium]
MDTVEFHYESVIRQAAERYRGVPGALLPILHHIQDTIGFIPSQTASELSPVLNLSRAEIHGVITYYHHFKQTPPTKHTLAICQAEACQARGCRSLSEQATQLLANDHDWHIEHAYCLGLCATGPAVEVDGKLKAHASIEKIQKWVKQTKENV